MSAVAGEGGGGWLRHRHLSCIGSISLLNETLGGSAPELTETLNVDLEQSVMRRVEYEDKVPPPRVSNPASEQLDL